MNKLFDTGVRVAHDAFPPTLGRTIFALPSKRHAKALQKLLGERINQADPIPYADFIANPEAYPDKTHVILLEAQTSAEIMLKLPPKTTFLADDVFVMTNDTKQVMPLRDQTSRKWGVNGGLTIEVMDRFHDVLETIPE